MTNTTTTKSDAVKRRLYARGTWKLKSVAHFGGEETGIADMCLLQDADKNPFIPAASIAGAARSFLARQRLTWAKFSHPDGLENEPPELKRLFGGAKEKDTMSALIIADATCVGKKVNTSIRDGVRIVHESGTAAEGAKFDVEVVERGTEFKLEMQCIIRHNDDEVALTRLFLAILHAFQQGDIRLGARTRRGYGRGIVKSWEIRDLQMDNQEDVMAWIRDDPWSRPKSNLVKDLEDYKPASDHRSYFRIEADFELRTSLLIRSSSEDPEAPDMTHLHSNEKPVIPGTSFAGAFRHRAALIANAIGWEKKDDEDMDAVCDMFGPVHKQGAKREETQQTDLWASRVSIEEQLVKKVEPQWQDRVAIDRFTGGSLQSALFNEKPVYPITLEEKTKTNVRLRLTLEEPEKAEIGLLLLTLRDFWHGNAAIGGETSNGRGTLQGIKAKLIYKDNPDPTNPKVWKLRHKDKCMTVEKDDEGFLQSCVKDAQNYSNQPTGSRRPKENGKGDSNA
jgi:CRISPR/Cas system CSM-associated protein Csm3 (group 7 of RAMP superfamily)